MIGSVEAPERIWIESEGGCPYFYPEEELSDVSPPITEYVRADKLRAEIDALLAEALRKLEERVQRDEALLRQALKALERGAWDTLLAKDAVDTVIALRERLGEKE